MIVDTLDNAALYHGLGANITKALRALEQVNLNNLPNGRHDIDGDIIYASVQRYETKARGDATWEAHERYIDIHFIVEGSEVMSYANRSDLSLHKPYDDETDTLRLTGEGSEIILRKGMFGIFFPQDAHIPRLAAGSPEPVFKIVIKALANLS